MITTDEIPLEKMQDMVFSHHCRCGGSLSVAWGGGFGFEGYVLRCGNDPQHHNFERSFEMTMGNCPDIPGWQLTKRRRKQLEQQVGKESSKLMRYQGRTKLKQEEVYDIFNTIWPRAMKEAPDVVKRAVLICLQYNLNPLMKQLHLIPFRNNKESRKQGKEVIDWAVARGIQSDRLLARRQGPFSYIDNTPRRMTEEEQNTTFGEVYKDRLWSIVRLRDPSTNAESVGYGFWLNEDDVYGAEKGNTAFNMASIRAERVALDRLHPGELPEDVMVIDEQFIPRGTLPETTTKVIESPAPVVTGTNKSPADEKSTTAEANLISVIEGLDMDWFKDATAAIKWNDETIKSWIGVNLKVPNTGTLVETLTRLNKEQLGRLCTEISNRASQLELKGE